MAEVETSDAVETEEAKEPTTEEVVEETPEEEPHPHADLIEELKKPIAGDNPCGSDVKYDEAFQELQNEVDRLGSATGDVDYDKIVELAHMILRDKSKDLMTAGYLTLGLIRTKEIAGIAEGLTIVHTLVDTFWDGLHPTKLVRRRNSIQFVADKIKDWLNYRLEKQKPKAEERKSLELAQETLKSLTEITMRELEDKAPALSGLNGSLREAIRRLPKPPPPPKPVAKPTAKAASGTPSTGDGASVASAPAGTAVPSEITSSTEAGAVIAKAAGFMRAEDKTDPVPYLLIRGLRWGKLKKEPPNDGGKTKIPAPLAQRLTYLNGLLEKGDYLKIIEDAEASFQQNPFHFWFGIQRLLVGAMEALGEPYRAAKDAILYETAALMKRLPKLSSLSFSDGTPFADPITEDWLESQVNAVMGSGGGGGSSKGGGSNHVIEQFKEARKKLGSGDLAGALSEMQKGTGEDRSQADRFQRRMYVADLCLKGGQPIVARAMLESLDEDVARHALDDWNPALAVEVWSNLYKCYMTLVKIAKPQLKGEYADKASSVLEKISRLDAAQALSVLSGG